MKKDLKIKTALRIVSVIISIVALFFIALFDIQLVIETVDVGSGFIIFIWFFVFLFETPFIIPLIVLLIVNATKLLNKNKKE